jgi:hypothetical protein
MTARQARKNDAGTVALASLFAILALVSFEAALFQPFGKVVIGAAILKAWIAYRLPFSFMPLR